MAREPPVERAARRKVMFDDVVGLSPQDAARWSALVEQCRSVHEHDGMEAVQAFLAERDVSIVQAIAITRPCSGTRRRPFESPSTS